MKKLQIAVIGSAGSQQYNQGGFDFDTLYQLSYEVGFAIAQEGRHCITGGKCGIMEGAAKGAKEGGGVTIGIAKGHKRNICNDYIDVEIITNMGNGGDGFLIPHSADGAIILGGGVGTLKEISGFYLESKPLVAVENTGGRAQKLAGTYLDPRELVRIGSAQTPKDAIAYIKQHLTTQQN